MVGAYYPYPPGPIRPAFAGMGATESAPSLLGAVVGAGVGGYVSKKLLDGSNGQAIASAGIGGAAGYMKGPVFGAVAGVAGAFVSRAAVSAMQPPPPLTRQDVARAVSELSSGSRRGLPSPSDHMVAGYLGVSADEVRAVYPQIRRVED